MFAKRRGNRFSIAAGLVCVVTGWFGPQARGQTNPITNGTISVKLHTVATLPTGTTGAPDFLTTDGVAGDARLFVLGQRGQIRIVNNGSLISTPFLDVNTALSGMFISPPSLNDERGLLGLAFSPDFANAAAPGFHKVYTFTSEDWSASSAGPTFANPELGPGNGPSGTTESVVREWTVSSTNPNVIDTALGSRVLFRIRKPQTNHNGGTLTFGPDKYLYITTGDGGGGNDNNGSPTSTTDGHSNSVNAGPPGNAQDTTQIYGKILRIKPTTDADPNTTLSANGQYRIPNSNPFTAPGNAGLDEIYAYGLRNPYRISFDSATGKLYAADVGQSAREEIDSIVNGGNYGWVLREGTLTNANIGGPYTTPPNLIAPIGQYTHADGIATIGGFVYRGSLIPSLLGKYVFGDLGGSNNGRLFYMDVNDPGPNTIFQLGVTLTGGGEAKPAADLHGFGLGADGEIYAAWSNGQITELIPEPAAWMQAAIGALILILVVQQRSGRCGPLAA
jgi:hypothetical protein